MVVCVAVLPLLLAAIAVVAGVANATSRGVRGPFVRGSRADGASADGATVWDKLTFGDMESEHRHGLSAVRSTAVSSPEPHRSLELNSSITFAMVVDLDVAAQFLSIRFSGSQWKNASDILSLIHI